MICYHNTMESRLKCSRREFFAAAVAFGSVTPVLGLEGDGQNILSRGIDSHLIALLSGVRTGGEILSRQISSILRLDPLPCRCVILPECEETAGAAAYEVSGRLAAAGIATVSAEPERVRVVPAKCCDLILLDDSGGSFALSVQKWLAAELPRWSRPLFICAVHPPEWKSQGVVRSLAVCGRPFRELLDRVPCLAGYLHSHAHRWQNASSSTAVGRMFPMLSLPSADGWGDIGHVLLHVSQDGAVAELRQDGFRLPLELPPEPRHADFRAMVAANLGATCHFRWS